MHRERTPGAAALGRKRQGLYIDQPSRTTALDQHDWVHTPHPWHGLSVRESL